MIYTKPVEILKSLAEGGCMEKIQLVKYFNMAFKLGKEKGNYAVNGVIKNKMKFSKQSGEQDVSVPDT